MSNNNQNHQSRPQQQQHQGGRKHVLAEGRFSAPLEGLGLRVVLEGKGLLVQLVSNDRADTALAIPLPKAVANVWRQILECSAQ